MKRTQRTDAQKAQILAEYESGEYSTQQLATKYGFNTTQALYTVISNYRLKTAKAPKNINRPGRKERQNKQEINLRKVQILMEYNSGASKEELMKKYGIKNEPNLTNILVAARRIDVTTLSERVYATDENGNPIDITDTNGLVLPLKATSGISDDLILGIWRDYSTLDWIKTKGDWNDRLQRKNENVSPEPRTYFDRMYPERGEEVMDFELVSEIANNWGISNATLDKALNKGVEKGIIDENELDKIRGIRSRRITRKKYESVLRGEDHPYYGVTGPDHPAYGKTREVSDETRQKISEALKDKPKNIKKILEERIKEIEDGDKRKEDEFILVSPHNRKKRREQAMNVLPFGHQALIAYLTDPKNYEQILGKGSRLVDADFHEDDTPPELYNRFRKRFEDLESIAHDEDHEIIDAVDGWMRYDVVFQKANGRYVVFEVKQNATIVKDESKKEGTFDNGKKGGEQVAGYSHEIAFNIKLFNHRTGSKLDENVEGVLIAYNIDPTVQVVLNGQSNLSTLILPKESVYDYVGKALETPKYARKEKAEVAEKKVRKNSPKRNSARDKFMEEVRRGTFPLTMVNLGGNVDTLNQTASYDPDTRIMAIGKAKFSVPNTKRNKELLKGLLKDGIIKTGTINI